MKSTKLESRLGYLSIRQRGMLLLVAAILPLIGLVVALLLVDRSETLAHVRQSVNEAALVTATDQAKAIENIKGVLSTLMVAPEVARSGFGDCSSFLASVKATNPRLNTLGVIDSEGIITCHNSLKVAQRHGDRDLLHRAQQPGASSFLVGHFMIGRVSGKPTVSMLMSFPKLDGKFAGGVFASLDLNWLTEALTGASENGRRTVLILETSTSRVLARYPPLTVPFGTAFPDHPLAQAFRASPDGGTIEAPGLDDVSRIHGFAPLPISGGADITVAVGVEREQVMAPVEQRITLTVLFLVAVVAAATALTWALGYWTYLRPINRLMRTAERIGAGEHEARATLEAWQAPEFRRFDESLAEMANKLALGRQAEEAVIERNRFMSIAERLAHVGYWQLDLRTMRSAWSDEVFRIYGLEPMPEPPTMDRLIETYHAKARRLIEETFDTAIKQGSEFEINLDLHRPAGDVRHVLSRGRVERDDAGRAIVVYGAFLDITEVKQAELAARSANAMLVMAEEVAEVGHWRFDVASQSLTWSDQIYRMHGLGLEYQPTVATAIELYHPDDQADVARDFAEAMRDKAGFEFQKRILRSDGTVREALSRGRCELDRASGEVTAVFGVIMDVTALRETERELAAKSVLLGTTLDTMDQGLIMVSNNGRLDVCNRRFAELLELPDDVVGHSRTQFDDILDYLDRRGEFGQSSEDFQRHVKTRGGPFTLGVYERKRPNGQILEVRTVPVPGGGGIVRTYTDVTAHHVAEERVRESEARFRMLSENTADLITHIDASGYRMFASLAAFNLLGYTPEELIGGRPIDLAHPDDRPAFRAMLKCLGEGRQASPVQYRARRKTGEYLWIEVSGRPLGTDKGYVLALRDIHIRKLMEEELETAVLRSRELANSDGLTGLANRRNFDKTLENELARTARHSAPVSLILVDIDHFKSFNDTYGHPAGDECLRRVAKLLQGAVRRPGDLAARYGGEEFGIILPETDAEGAKAVAGALRLAVEKAGLPHASSNYGVVTISVGIATIGSLSGSLSPIIIIEQADRALYEAKRTGRNSVRHSAELDEAFAGIA